MFFNFSELKLQEITVRQRSMLCMPPSSCPCGFCEPCEASGLVPVSSECLWTSSWGGSVVFLDVLKAGFHLLLLFPTYKSISSGIYRFFLLLFWSIDNLRKPLKIKVLGGEDSIHSVLSEFLIVLKIHLNLDGKCMGQHNGYEHRLWNQTAWVQTSTPLVTIAIWPWANPLKALGLSSLIWNTVSLGFLWAYNEMN